MSLGGSGVAVGAMGVLVGGTREGVMVAGVPGWQALRMIAIITLEIVITRPVSFNFMVYTPGRHITTDVIPPYRTDASSPFFVPRAKMLKYPELT